MRMPTSLAASGVADLGASYGLARRAAECSWGEAYSLFRRSGLDWSMRLLFAIVHYYKAGDGRHGFSADPKPGSIFGA